jgi:hypothetical protein
MSFRRESDFARLQQLLQEAEERAEQERKRAEEAERLRREEQLLFERRIGKSTLPEFLDACHTHFYLGLTIQPDSTQSTQGDGANAENKPRPDRILPWPGFDEQQAGIWEALMESDLVNERHFTSLHTLEESGEAIRVRTIGSELDLNSFARFTVEDPVAQIIERLYEDKVLRTRFGLKGSVRFENHSNTLSPDRAAEGIQSLNISANPRRSERLRNNTANTQTIPSSSTTHQSRPRADQFCVYNISSGEGEIEYRIAVLIIEYKPPHKLTLAHIIEGLGGMDLDEIVEQKDDESVAVRCRRLVAAVITQGFSYMVKAGLEYGEIYTGEATIFLRIPDDPSTVYYALSVPKGDVGSSTGWEEHGEHPNRLHLTAVGQAVAFTLRALGTPPRGAQWVKNALGQLKTWGIVVKEAEEAIATDEAPSSEYRPSSNVVEDVNRSPIQLRLRKRVDDPEACAPAISALNSNEEDEDSGPDTPSRPAPISSSSGSKNRSTRSKSGDKQAPRNEGMVGGVNRERNSGPFCTTSCLLSLIGGGQLDQLCPNVKKHGKGSHSLNRSTFMEAVLQMLDTQLDHCQDLYKHGARGALFKIKLPGYCYTLIAKGTGIECANDLIHESAVYQRLQPIQGKHIPVYLGNTTVPGTLYYAGAVRIVHMIFLSFAGFSLRPPISQAVVEEAILGLQAIHQLGVLQRDPVTRNILVHPDRSELTWIDFERAEIFPLRVPLGILSPNRKRKLGRDNDNAKCNLGKSTRASLLEIDEARAELTRLVRA